MSYSSLSSEAEVAGSTATPPLLSTPRQYSLAALVMADVTTLEAAAKQLSADIRYTFLRRPEVGLIMLEARASNAGQRFNLGEMLVTRCVLRLEEQEGCEATEGYAFLQGNRPRHAELVALFDALLQQEQWADELQKKLIVPLMEERQRKQTRTIKETATTKVDFFTMVRGEDE